MLLDYSELLYYLSMVRLGVELSIIDLDKGKLNEIMISCNDYSLQDGVEGALSSKEIKHKRANRVKEILS